MKKAIYAGSFDPVTLGHMDIIERAAKLFDVLVVAVLENPNKKSLFTVAERKHHLELATKHIENVEVASFQGLFVDFAKEIGADVAVRGLRNTLDFSAEYPMYLITDPSSESIDSCVENIKDILSLQTMNSFPISQLQNVSFLMSLRIFCS